MDKGLYCLIMTPFKKRRIAYMSQLWQAGNREGLFDSNDTLKADNSS